jgi:hypothetical protein
MLVWPALEGTLAVGKEACFVRPTNEVGFSFVHISDIQVLISVRSFPTFIISLPDS